VEQSHEVRRRRLRAIDITDPWPHVMIACLNPEPGPTGKVDRAANVKAVEPGGPLDQIVETTRPIVMLACGGEVHRAVASWSARVPVAVTPVSHPMRWGSFAGSRHGPEVARRLAEELPSNGARK
jgi:hypothetical protein